MKFGEIFPFSEPENASCNIEEYYFVTKKEKKNGKVLRHLQTFSTIFNLIDIISIWH